MTVRLLLLVSNTFIVWCFSYNWYTLFSLLCIVMEKVMSYTFPFFLCYFVSCFVFVKLKFWVFLKVWKLGRPKRRIVLPCFRFGSFVSSPCLGHFYKYFFWLSLSLYVFFFFFFLFFFFTLSSIPVIHVTAERMDIQKH